VQADRHRSRRAHAAFEDGTPTTWDLPAIEYGLDLLERSGSSAMHARVAALTAAARAPDALRHATARRWCASSARRDRPPRRHGGVQLLRRSPTAASSTTARSRARAAARRISLRTGCFCNPGAGEAALGLDREEIERCFPGAFFGILRDALLAAAPRAFLRVLLWGFVALAVTAFVVSARRIREWRAARFGALAAAAFGVAALAGGLASGMPEVDAVERIHVLAYGLLAFLFARGFAARGDLSTWLLALFSTVAVGVIDEWVQWLVPTRVGVAEDVALNAASALPGLLVAWAVRPSSGSLRLRPESHRPVLALLALVVALFAGFYDRAHLGYRIESSAIGSFLSFHSPEGLRSAAAERAERWRERPPTELAPLAREDFFLTEGTWRVAARNAALARGDLTMAWLEHRLLEEHYAPVLDLRGLRSGDLHRWPDWKKEDVERRRPQPDPADYASPVLAHRIRVWPRGPYWSLAGTAVVFLLACAARQGSVSTPR
jgi:hypothetical protein